jgi:NAD(P)-dependent dehydrogenase (short-subunit alcohol dehydrogenase family)
MDPMTNPLADQRVVVLGGTSGLGLATARAAAAAGATVVVASSTPARVDAALELLPDDAEGRVVDLGDEAAIARLLVELGRFDHLVYTAGEALQLAMLADTSAADAAAVLRVRVWGAYAAVRAAAPNLRPGGSIVLSSGTAGPRPSAGWSVGALICGGMEALTRAFAVELAPLRVNAVRPGVVRTDLWRDLPTADRDALFAGLAASLPAGRVGEPEDVAAANLYLMTNPYTTGTVLTVDGGTLVA